MATPDTPPAAVARTTFGVPAPAVWRYRLDFANLPEYNSDVSDVARVADGDPSGPGGVHGPGARYRFQLAGRPIELWAVDVVEPTLVAAGMAGDQAAYEEFVVQPLDDGRCEATLTLWLSLPEGLPDHLAATARAGGLEQITKELRLMRDVLEDPARRASTP